MKKTAIIILIVVVVAVGFVATVFLMGESGADKFSIKSNDQLAELIIPKDTLPEDVTINDISVTRISTTQFDDEFLIVYDLEPDGLEFTDEILFKISLDGSGNVAPIVFVSTSTGLDLANNTITEIDLETKKQNVTVPLTHFSEIVLNPLHGTYNIDASALDTPVGEQVLTEASFTLYKDKIFLNNTVSGPRIIVWELLEPSVAIKGVWKNFHTSSLTPTGKFGGKPTLTDVHVGQSVTVNDDTFTCNAPGLTNLFYEVEIITSMKIVTYASEEDYLAGNGVTSGTMRNYKHTQIVLVVLNGIKVSDEGSQTDPEEESRTDHRVEPEVEMTYNWTYEDDLIVDKQIIVDIKARPGANGTVTLTGPDMQEIRKTVFLDAYGRSRVAFDIIAFGKYTALVYVDEFVVEKEVWA